MESVVSFFCENCKQWSNPEKGVPAFTPIIVPDVDGRHIICDKCFKELQNATESRKRIEDYKVMLKQHYG